jgi:hypothetical protein
MRACTFVTDDDAALLIVFVSQQTSYKVLNMDQWTNLFDFLTGTKADLSNYDTEAACTFSLRLSLSLSPFIFVHLVQDRSLVTRTHSLGPVLIDEYVAWAKKSNLDGHHHHQPVEV